MPHVELLCKKEKMAPVRNVEWVRTAGHPESNCQAAGTLHGEFLKDQCKGYLIFSSTKNIPKTRSVIIESADDKR